MRMDESAKHTPGPWSVFQAGVYPGVEAGDMTSIVVFGNLRESSLGVKGRTDEEAQANAKLIAAAPDMLAALEAIEKDADWTGKNAERQYAAMGLVRAAIAKARKEPSHEA